MEILERILTSIEESIDPLCELKLVSRSQCNQLKNAIRPAVICCLSLGNVLEWANTNRFETVYNKVLALDNKLDAWKPKIVPLNNIN